MKSKKIAYSGMLLAVNTILFIMLNIFQHNTIFIMGLASCIVAIIIMEWGVGAGILFYVASVIMGFMIIANKLYWIVYALTFGTYGIAKFFIEKSRSLIVEYILKLLYANISLAITYFAVKNIVYIPTDIYLLLGFEVAFLIYDYVYSMFIDYYNRNLKRFIR